MDPTSREYLARIVAFHFVNRDTVTVNDRELNIYSDALLYATITMRGYVIFACTNPEIEQSAEGAYGSRYNLKERGTIRRALTMLTEFHGWVSVREPGARQMYIYPHGRRESLYLDANSKFARDQCRKIVAFIKSEFLNKIHEEYTQQMQTTDGNGKKRRMPSTT